MREVAMLTRITIVVVSAFTMLLLAPLGTNASPQGVAQPSHFKGQPLAHHHRHHHHRAFGPWPWYGYYYDVPSYASDLDMTYSTPETVVAPTSPTVGCQHSEQTVKVPSENGEVREVTILRC